MEVAADAALEPDHALARQDAVRTAVSRFLELPPAQRSCVILKDVLEHSLEEIAAMLELSIPAIKAALHRGRAGFGSSREPANKHRCARHHPRSCAMPSCSTPAIG